MKEFYIDSDGTRLHAKLDCPEGVKKGPLCILIHGFTGDMEEEHLIAARDAMTEAGFVTDLILCGHSQGGLLTMLVGGMFPDDFKAIIPLSPAWMIPENAREGIILGMTFDPEHIPESIAFDERELSGDYIRVARTIHVEDEIARYEGPVLIVHGDEDESVPFFSMRRRLKDSIKTQNWCRFPEMTTALTIM